MDAEPNAPQTTPAIPEEWIQELAAAGALCQVCGGIHLVSMDQLILASPQKFFGESSGVEVPWCSCPRCPDCGPWKKTAAATAERLLRESNGELPR